jgi:sugar phosphate isomerase/epimerase
LEGELNKVIDDHRELRCDTIILPWIGKEDYADGWSSFARRLDAIAERLAEAKMSFAYHNHAFEFENDGLRTLFQSASQSVKAQLDLGWVQHAGENPADFVRELGSRISSVHLKDTMGFEEHEDVLAGEGVVDWNATLAACVDVGVPVGVIEMDNPPGDPMTSVKECHRFYSSHLK